MASTLLQLAYNFKLIYDGGFNGLDINYVVFFIFLILGWDKNLSKWT